MKAKLLKFLKWFLTILLIVGAVGLTVFIFFKNYKSKEIQKVDLNSVLNSTDKQKFDNGLDNTITILSNNGQTDWFTVLKTTSTKLDSSLDVLVNYYIDDNFVVRDENIDSTYSSMINTRSLLISMFNEYSIKADSVYFKKDIGANDIYSTYSTYLVRYARFIQAVDNNLKNRSGFDYYGDVKFSIIDLQTRIVISSFSNLTEKNNLNVITTSTDINLINSYVSYRNSYIFGNNTFGVASINFIQNYEACNKTYLAEHFAEEVGGANSISESSSAEKKSAYYFKSIF